MRLHSSINITAAADRIAERSKQGSCLPLSGGKPAQEMAEAAAPSEDRVGATGEGGRDGSGDGGCSGGTESGSTSRRKVSQALAMCVMQQQGLRSTTLLIDFS